MFKPFLFSLFSFLSISLNAGMNPDVSMTNDSTAYAARIVNNTSAHNMLYDSLQLDKFQLSRDAFIYAMAGYEKMRSSGTLANPDILTIVDFSLPSDQKRLFVLDMATGQVLFNTYVAHGRNSGAEVATRFSNELDSYKSSLGFYVTLGTYRGEHGYSLRLQGKEEGINSNAYNRNIVVHGAPYVSEKMIAQKGYIGRSLGCPAIPQKLHKPIINKIQNGSCLFLYGPDKDYVSRSAMIG
jgi:hypothetical protein